MTLTALVNKRQSFRHKLRDPFRISLLRVDGPFASFDVKCMDESEHGMGVLLKSRVAPQLGEVLSDRGLFNYQVCWVKQNGKGRVKMGLQQV